MGCKKGDWVRFATQNWPLDITAVTVEIPTGQTYDSTDVGLYRGSGKVVATRAEGCTVREYNAVHGKGRLVRLRYDLDQIEKMDCSIQPLTLGQLRKVLAECRDLPDDVPIAVTLPVAFWGDEGALPEDHPEFKDFAEVYSVPACSVVVIREEDDSDCGPMIEVIPHPHNAYDALRGETGTKY